MSTNSGKTAPGGAFRFRVSDSLDVPLRGHLLRLKLLDGNPSIKDLAPGRKMRVAGGSGADREVAIVGHSSTGGRMTQARLDGSGELDVVIRKEDAGSGRERIEIGWEVSGPVA